MAVPRGPARDDRAPHVALSGEALGGAARVARRAGEARLAVAGGDRPGGRRDAGHARPISSRSPPSTTCSSWIRSGRHTIYMCTNLSCQLRGAHDVLQALSRGHRRAGRRVEPRRPVPPALVRVPGRLRPRPDGLDRRPLPRPADARGRVTRSPTHLRDGGAPADVLPDKRFEETTREATGGGRSERRGDPASAADVPDLHRVDTYERLGGYRGLRRALTEMTPDQVVRELEASGLRGRGGAGFSMGKKASFLPTARSTSTCAATPTSPSPARSRTAS